MRSIVPAGGGAVALLAGSGLEQLRDRIGPVGAHPEPQVGGGGDGKQDGNDRDDNDQFDQ